MIEALLFILIPAAILGFMKLSADARTTEAALKALSARVRLLESQRTQGADTSSAPAAAAQAAPAPGAIPPQTSSPPQPVAARDWEKTFAENWLVWIGGVTLALGGGFLVKFSIDYGLMTPVMRTFVGVILGVGLAASAEYVLRRESRASRPVLSSYVTPALAAAGVATAFASIYAAYELYDLLPSIAAFLLLAFIALAAVVLSLRHGPYVAGLGLLGAFAVPVLVSSDNPSADGLFLYLTVVVAGSLLLLRYKAWLWLGWVSVAGAAGWALVWLASAHAATAPIEVGLFASVQLVLFITFRRGVPAIPLLAGAIDVPVVRRMVRTAVWSFALVLLVLVRVSDFGTASLVFALLATAYVMGSVFKDQALEDLLLPGFVLLAATLAGWSFPFAPVRDALLRVPQQDVARFETFALAVVFLLCVPAFLAIPFARRPQRWAAQSAAALPAILALSYWRLQVLEPDMRWAAVGIVLAGIELGFAHWAARRRDRPDGDAVLATYAAGVLSCTILAAAFVLREAWLTVALALHLPAVAWVERRIDVRVLQTFAMVVAGVVILRLILNPAAIHYPMSPSLLFNWGWYGYGLPCAAFLAAIRLFRGDANPMLMSILEAGSAAFFTFLVTLELRHALGESTPLQATLGFWNSALQSLAWLVIAAALLEIGRRHGRQTVVWCGIVLLGVSTLTIALVLGIDRNPVFNAEPVGRLLILDALTCAFGVPAVIYAVIAARRLGFPWLWIPARVFSFALAFLWVSLEVRHGFRGEYLSEGRPSAGEWYAYSVAWLAFAAACIAAGFFRNDQWLRRVGLLGVCVVVAKVFLSDMSELEGIWRALSFLGLGATLVAVGYGYRYLEPAKGAAPAVGS